MDNIGFSDIGFSGFAGFMPARPAFDIIQRDGDTPLPSFEVLAENAVVLSYPTACHNPLEKAIDKKVATLRAIMSDDCRVTAMLVFADGVGAGVRADTLQSARDLVELHAV